MANRVFVLEPIAKDIRKAETFGKIKYLWSEGDYRPSIWDKIFESELIDKLKESKFDENDFVLIIGPVTPLITLTHVLSNKLKLSSFKVLFWHATIQDYVCRSFANEG